MKNLVAIILSLTLFACTDGGFDVAGYSGHQQTLMGVPVTATPSDSLDDAETIAANAATAGASGGITFATGVYDIASDLTIPCVVNFEPGASLNIVAGKTVTFQREMHAGLYQVFSGPGTVVLSPYHTPTGFPEWWGATIGGGDCLAAIQACLVACPVTQLQRGDYFTPGTVVMRDAGRSLVGMGAFYDGDSAHSTRLVVNSGSAHCLRIGPDSQPASINLYPQGIRVSDLQLSRGASPVIESHCNGLLAQFCLYPSVDNVKSVESMRGFEFVGCVGGHFDDCWAARSVAGAGAGSDYWLGFYVNGNASIPSSGGNASVYFNRLNASNTGGPVIASSGIYIDSKWADTFVNEPEANGCGTGISIQGNGSPSFGYGETDLHIIKPVVDAYHFAGIHISNAQASGAISIQGGFSAPAIGSSPTASVYISNSRAPVSIGGFQHVLGSATVTAGLLIIDSANVTSYGSAYVECDALCVAMNGASNCYIADRATNYSKTASAIVQMVNGTANKLEVSASGALNCSGLGYQLIGTSNDRNELNCTGLDSASIGGGSANKLISNGVQITSAGAFGTNLATGIMQ